MRTAYPREGACAIISKQTDGSSLNKTPTPGSKRTRQKGEERRGSEGPGSSQYAGLSSPKLGLLLRQGLSRTQNGGREHVRGRIFLRGVLEHVVSVRSERGLTEDPRRRRVGAIKRNLGLGMSCLFTGKEKMIWPLTFRCKDEPSIFRPRQIDTGKPSGLGQKKKMRPQIRQSQENSGVLLGLTRRRFAERKILFGAAEKRGKSVRRSDYLEALRPSPKRDGPTAF